MSRRNHILLTAFTIMLAILYPVGIILMVWSGDTRWLYISPAYLPLFFLIYVVLPALLTERE